MMNWAKLMKRGLDIIFFTGWIIVSRKHRESLRIRLCLKSGLLHFSSIPIKGDLRPSAALAGTWIFWSVFVFHLASLNRVFFRCLCLSLALWMYFGPENRPASWYLQSTICPVCPFCCQTCLRSGLIHIGPLTGFPPSMILNSCILYITQQTGKKNKLIQASIHKLKLFSLATSSAGFFHHLDGWVTHSILSQNSFQHSWYIIVVMSTCISYFIFNHPTSAHGIYRDD